MAGFEWKYNISGGRPLIHTLFAIDPSGATRGNTLTKGDIGNVDTGQLDLGATNDAAFLGAIVGAFDPADEATPGVITATAATTRVKCIANPDAVYETADANDRDYGALLDLSGATGAQTVAASSNNDFMVVEDKRQAADGTRVKFAVGEHLFD